MDPVTNLFEAAETVAEDPNSSFAVFTTVLEMSDDIEALKALQNFFLAFNEMIQAKIDNLAE